MNVRHIFLRTCVSPAKRNTYKPSFYYRFPIFHSRPSMQILRSFEIFTGAEKRNIAIYVIGIMFYKFGLEAFNGSIATLAQDRFNATHTFTKWGVLTGLNQAMQCVGSIIIAPLIRRYPTRTVLSLAILAFGLLTTVLLILDRATGGRIKTNGQVHYGTYNPDSRCVIRLENQLLMSFLKFCSQSIHSPASLMEW